MEINHLFARCLHFRLLSAVFVLHELYQNIFKNTISVNQIRPNFILVQIISRQQKFSLADKKFIMNWPLSFGTF